MDIHLQKTTEENWKVIDELMRNAESHTFHATKGEEAVKKFIQSDEVFIILYENKNAGLVAYHPNETSNYLSELVVAPEFQGKGIATQAIKVLLEQIENKLPMELHTHPDNKSAIKVYWKLGFEIKGWVDNYLGEGEPRLLLVRS